MTMLWYKAWRESRVRFTISVAAIVCFCVFAVMFNKRLQTNGTPFAPDVISRNYSEHVYQLMYSGSAKGVFAMLTIFLGLGGLLRERAHRTAVFTLAFPVSRLRIALTQIAVGMAQLAMLSLLPAVLIPSLSLLVHQYFPVTEALHFSILWFICGSVIFATSFLLSAVLPGEYTAPVICYVALMVQALVAQWGPLRAARTNLLWTMGEFNTMHWDLQHNLLLSGALPWARLCSILLISAVMLAAAARITQVQDY